MWRFVKGCLDRWPFCVVTRPLAGLVGGGALGGAFVSLGGLVLGAIHGAPYFAIAAGIRGAFAGAAAGFLVGLGTAVDLATWPAEEMDGPGDPSPPKPSLNGHAAAGEQAPAVGGPRGILAHSRSGFRSGAPGPD